MSVIDLNSDLGESLGAWSMGDDAAMLDIVSSANVACGFHAGDPLTMRRTVALAAEKGVTIECKDFNGQNDATTLNQIGTQVVADGYDAIIPIATLAAQCMTTAAESTKTPVIYAAISDPAAADLTDIDYVTGTSDALNTQSIMDMMFAVQPDIQTVGLLYSNSEANSTTPIAEAKAYLAELWWMLPGSLLIAPTAFTHTHRGNRPQGGDKFIATSWILFQSAQKLFGGR